MMIMMKSSLAGPLFLLFLLLNFSSTVSGLGSVLVKSVTYIQNYSTWPSAQEYCRSSNYYTDLAVIYNQLDADIWDLESYNAWIGMIQSNGVWFWTNGEYVDFNNVPYINLDWAYHCAYNSYINDNYKSYCSASCDTYYFFICSKNDNNYKFINQSKTWSDAQQYCLGLNLNLAVIKDNGHLNAAVTQQDFPVWVGLYRDGETWKWSTGLSEYRNWAPNEPSNNGDCVAIYSVSKTMIVEDCSARFPFVCFTDNLLMVNENKTWEEAMEYCQTLTSTNNSPYKLVSVQPGDDYSYMKNKVMEANTDEVWTGLRFLAGNWVWVNGADMTFSGLPLCPINWQYCGAFSKNNTGGFETRDCLEKKNFLCYSL